MNSTFNSALKQSTSIRKDLDAFAENPAASSLSLQGQLSASLTSFSRTLDDYNTLAKRELIPTKQEKAYERIKKFRSELHDYRTEFDRLKSQREEAQTTINRTELLGRRPHHTATPENPYSNASVNAAAAGSSPWAPPGQSGLGLGSQDYTRETHALREQNFFQHTNNTLDEYLARGQAVLGDLGAQREMLKGTQKRLYSVANTLGISGDTIRMVERRAKQDKWIFYAGVNTYEPSAKSTPSRKSSLTESQDSSKGQEPSANIAKQSPREGKLDVHAAQDAARVKTTGTASAVEKELPKAAYDATAGNEGK